MLNKTTYFKVDLPALAIIISTFIIVLITFDLSLWQDDKKVIESDIISYYAYLPTTFIFQDMSMRYVDKAENDVKQRIYYEKAENGGRVIKTTMGVSYFYLPFFIFCHHLTPSFDYSQNGYTPPYRISILLSSIFFFMLGLIFLRKLLCLYYDNKVVFWTILIVGAGTNIVNYATREAGMSHVYSFSAITAFLYFTDKWFKKPTAITLYIVCFILGLITIVRPTNLMVGLVFLLYGIGSISDLKERFLLIWDKKLIFAIGAIIAFIPIFPQLLYWKYTSGSWLFFSYTDNESFFFNDPKIWQGLFSYRKGWLLYTPLMSLAFLGMFVPHKYFNKQKWALGIFIVLLLYVTFSWWSWWYGGSFGSRVMVDHYGIFALAIAAFIALLFRINRMVRYVSLLIIVAFIYLNQFQNYQYREGFLHYSGMNKKTYWMMFMNDTKITKEYYDSLDEIDNEAAKRGERD